jgi:signal transduction histidine kinase
MNNFSLHYQNERTERERFIEENIGYGDEIYSFEYDYNGAKQIHKITDTGLINVYDRDGGKLITRLVARPQQIKRLFNQHGEQAPRDLVRLADYHARNNFNEI